MPGLTHKLFGGTTLYPKVKALGHYPDYLWWLLRGRPVRSPHLLKQKTVVEYGRRYGFRTLVETGTYYGEMIDAALGHFDRIYSIELDPELAALARRRFSRYPEVHVVEGSSQEKVPEVLAGMGEPCLFWMDAGYYGTGAQLGNLDRLLVELRAILSHPVKDHVVLMDDARVFTGAHGGLTAAQLVSWIEQEFPGRKVSIECDIFRVAPR